MTVVAGCIKQYFDLEALLIQMLYFFVSKVFDMPVVRDSQLVSCCWIK